MDALAFEHHLTSPQGLGHWPAGASTVTAGGGSCCDRVRFSISLDGTGTSVADAGFDAEGCGSATAAASAAVELVRGLPLTEVAAITPARVADALGGLSPGKRHAADLAVDAMARALGAAAASGAQLPPAGIPRTLVAMSGGVDSAVAALLSARRGEALAVTLELWADPEHDPERSCCSSSAVSQARAMAHAMGLPHFTLDLRDAFRAGVVEPFIKAHAAGETPNPCVRCNGQVRLEAMLALARRLGCQTLSTGHYARVVEPDGGHPLLRAAADAAKDQSYMLAATPARVLAQLRFPLGDLTKPQVREQARQAGLPVAGKPDSQDLCFLAGTDRSRFLARHGRLSRREGEIVDLSGRVLGRHPGQASFTVGQRRGLGIAAEEPLFVLEKDAPTNRVTVGGRQQLETRHVQLRDVRLERHGARVNRVRLRYRSPSVPARATGAPGAGPHGRLTLELEEPFAGVAPGQLACLLDGDVVVGHGTIVARTPREASRPSEPAAARGQARAKGGRRAAPATSAL